MNNNNNNKLDLSKLDGLNKITKECGWWWPFENAVILTERPRYISRDDQFRLHKPLFPEKETD